MVNLTEYCYKISVIYFGAGRLKSNGLPVRGMDNYGMDRSIKYLSVFFLIFLVFTGGIAYSSSKLDNLDEGFDPVDIIKAIEEGYNRVNDYKAIFLKREYVDGKLLPLETIEFKFRKPGDIYMKWLTSPYKDQEALYRYSGKKIKVHKGGILGMLAVDIDPRSALAMKNQHHPIYDAGIGSTTAMLKKGLQAGIKRGECSIEYSGELNIDGRNTLVLEAEFPVTCEGILHVVGKNENLWDIAEKYDQDAHVIMHNNDNIKEFNDIRPGQEILIPYHYCQRIVVYIDRQLELLIKLEIFDWNGNLYEIYHYDKLSINVGLTDDDFNPDNPVYNF